MERMFARRDWKERTEKGASGQINCVVALYSLNMSQSAFDGHTTFSSDHSLVYADFSGPGLLVSRERTMNSSLLTGARLSPGSERLHVNSGNEMNGELVATNSTLWQWNTKSRHHIAIVTICNCPSLVKEARKCPTELIRMFSKRLWRIRRSLRRQRNNAWLAAACTAGRAPLEGAKPHHVNWKRLFGDTDPAEAISKFHGGHLRAGRKGPRESQCTKMWLDSWLKARDESICAEVTGKSLCGGCQQRYGKRSQVWR